MAYDEDLADRLRQRMGHDPRVTERRMFGGLAFLFGGHMAVVVSSQGGLMVRADPETAAELVANTPARFAEMQGKQMDRWVRIADEHLHEANQLATWSDVGLAAARSLPPKG